MRSRPGTPLIDRLYAGLDRSQGEDGCWEWMHATDQHGYGVIRVDGKNHRPHRKLWEIEVGPIPEGKHLCHHCDNPRCSNPKHLFIGGQRENLRDASEKGRTARGSRHGHAKLFERDIPIIRLMAENGWSNAEMARHYRVSTETIWGIVHRETWTHID